MPQKKKINKKLPRRKKQNSKPPFLSKYFSVIVSVSAAFLFGLVVGGYFYIDSKEVVKNVDSVKKLTQQLEKLPTYEEKAQALNIEYAKDNKIQVEEPKKLAKNEDPDFHFEEPDYGKVDEIIEKEKSIVEKIIPKVKETVKEKLETVITPKQNEQVDQRPKLILIIDDVTTQYQIRKIKNIGYPVNVSLLPPTKGHPNSDKIAEHVQYHMIHLPLQASSFKYEEEDTLHVGDSYERIEKKIASLRHIYPDAKYINNHTGSKFTSNVEAMDKLFQAIKKHNYIFLDSRTTAKSVARKLAKKHDLKIYSRDVFLDNEKNKPYIQNQLKEAITTAKRNGMAIAIGHPYDVTIKTLQESKHLLEGLDLIYIDQL